MSDNFLADAKSVAAAMDAEQFFRAVVQGNVGNLVTIRRTGHSVDDAQSYPKLNFTSVNVGDEVIVAKVGSGFVILGQIRR